MLKEISKVRQHHIETTGDVPRSIALSYEDGLCLMVEFSKSKPFGNDVNKLLARGNRAEIKEYLNKTQVYGMSITVVDIVAVGGKS